MKLSDDLLYDHEVLRGKLALIEEYLPTLAAVPVTLLRLTDSLAAYLRHHTLREEQLLAMIPVNQGSLAGQLLHHLHDAHENTRTRLAVLHELLTQAGGTCDPQVTVQAEYLIHDLRAHMAEVETLFPLLDALVPCEVEEALALSVTG